MTNTDKVERLRELLGKATEGPWGHSRSLIPHDGQYDYGISSSVEKVVAEAFGRSAAGGILPAQANAALIVEAINALPALLDAVEALEWYASQETYADGPSVSDVAWAPEIPALSDRGKRARTALATLKGEG